MRMKNRVAIITGGGRGIGAATAKIVAAQGGNVVLADLLDAEGEATAAAIRASGGDALFVRTNVSSEKDCAALVQAAVEKFGRVDILICCAGILRGAMLQAEALDESVFQSVLDVNLRGTFLTVKAALPQLRKAEKPVVILLASEAGTKIPSSSLAYGASKGGVHGFAMTLEAQLAPHGIRVNEVCPSSIATPMRIENLVDRARAAGKDPEQARIEAIKDAGDPQGVAEILAFLASSEADYVRGAIYTR
ncbi:MAG TPA: SDR family NAD(P)-dependent oxidoreductase [Candidatus Baltobacteraceae bacterium]|nr:SDR family NAD(P)-dependent oxidoreductase [Candidatus Baltobacteraceae bacterium]